MAPHKPTERLQRMLLDGITLRLDEGRRDQARLYGTLTDSATNVAVDYPLDLTPAAALDQVEEVSGEALRWDLLLCGQVAAARVAGASWAAIGSSLGISGEGARRRYSARIGES